MDRNVNVGVITKRVFQTLFQSPENFAKPRAVEPLTRVAVKTGVFDCVSDSSTLKNRIARLGGPHLPVW